jgi:hypothetical protein
MTDHRSELRRHLDELAGAIETPLTQAWLDDAAALLGGIGLVATWLLSGPVPSVKRGDPELLSRLETCPPQVNARDLASELWSERVTAYIEQQLAAGITPTDAVIAGSG